jgi:lipoate-protein ligase A
MTTGGQAVGRVGGQIVADLDRLDTRPPDHLGVDVDWTLAIDGRGRSGAENMAIDVALLREAQAGRAALRLYRWSPPCLSFGRNEPALSRYDPGRIAERGLATVRRPTGGRAVWHENEVTYAVAAPCDHFGSLPEAYRAIHRMLSRALARLGVPATLAARRGRAPAPGAGACFASPVGGEIVAGGRKLVGSAQVRQGTAFLQHGSILLTDGQKVVTDVSIRQTIGTGATSLSAVLGRSVTFEEVADAIIAEARASWTGRWTERRPEPSAAEIACFADEGWTWRR